jgi:hypothetical protein
VNHLLRTPIRMRLLLAAVVGLGLSLLPVTTAPATGPRATQASAKTIRFRVLNASGGRWSIRDSTPGSGHWRGDGPKSTPNVDDLSVTDYTLESENNAASVDTRWEIGDTGYRLDVSGSFSDPRRGWCTIDNSQGQATDQFPFRCAERHTGTYDLDVYAVISPKEPHEQTLTAGKCRRAVWEHLCGSTAAIDTGYASCNPGQPKDKRLAPGPAKQSGDIVLNCGTSTLSQEVASSTHRDRDDQPRGQHRR